MPVVPILRARSCPDPPKEIPVPQGLWRRRMTLRSLPWNMSRRTTYLAGRQTDPPPVDPSSDDNLHRSPSYPGRQSPMMTIVSKSSLTMRFVAVLCLVTVFSS